MNPIDTLAGFGVSAESASKVLSRAMARGGDFCDLFFQRSRSLSLGLQDGAVNSASTSADAGLGVRVVHGDETGYAYTESLDEASMLEAAAVAASIAAGAQGKAPTSFAAGKLGDYYPVKTPMAQVPTPDKVALLMDLQKRVTKRDARIEKVTVSYTDSLSEIVVLDSEGRAFADRKPMVICYVGCVAEQKGQRESNRVGLGARRGLDLFTPERLDTLAAEVVDRTVVLFEAVPGPVGDMPVVLGAGSAGILLHEAIGHGMEADYARKRTTIYTDMVGKSIAPKDVTIVDEGTTPGLRGSINVDDEGRPSQRTTLVEDGVFRTFMHDRISAAHYGVEPTGNGRRQSFRHRPLPRMRNTAMLAGPHSPEELVSTVKKGIYADHFTNGQVSIGAGDFSFYVKNGMLIEDGKLTRPIKDVNVIGNGPEVLRKVSMVGSDFAWSTSAWTCGKQGQRVPVGVGMPSVKVDSITVGGTSKG